MSTTEPLEGMADPMHEPWDDLHDAPSIAPAEPLSAAIVPKSSIAGRSLAAVVAIMTFLAALTTGAAMLVLNAASDWRADVGREVTIQVRPLPSRDIEADVKRAAEIARATRGIADVQVFSKDQSAELVEPWLGNGLKLDDLPIPRMIVIKLASSALPDLAALRSALATQVSSASLDDHRRWIERMRTMAGSAVVGGLAVLGLVLAVTMLSVTFATRGAMATNRPTVEVLHYVGATDRFVAGQFQRHFLVLGFKGGAIGGGAAILLFGCLEAASAWHSGTASGAESTALFGSLSIGASGYLAIVAEILVMAIVTAVVSRHTVNRTLESMD